MDGISGLGRKHLSDDDLHQEGETVCFGCIVQCSDFSNHVIQDWIGILEVLYGLLVHRLIIAYSAQETTTRLDCFGLFALLALIALSFLLVIPCSYG